MWERNDGKSESSILQNEFTAYLVKAVSRSKSRYLHAKGRQYQHELHAELDGLYQSEPDLLDGLPVIEQLENHRLQSALGRLKERDLYILFARVLEQRSFVELSEELGLGYKAVAAIYYRMVANIKKELGGEGK